MKNKLKISLSLVPLFVVIFLIWMYWDDITGINYAPQVRITELDFNNRGYNNKFMIRRESPESKNLLMKLSDGNRVYIYQPATRQFSYEDGKLWDAAQGEIKVCGTNIMSPIGSVSQAYGKHTLNSEFDSTLTKKALITSNGFSIPAFGVLPNLGGNGRITGVRYFEVLSSENEKIGKTLRIKKLEMDSSPCLCWSKDNDFVVVSNSSYSTLAVIDISELESK